MTFGSLGAGTGMDNSIPEVGEREGNGKNPIPKIRKWEGNEKSIPKIRERERNSIPTFRERESEAIILGNSWEQEWGISAQPWYSADFFINANYSLIPKIFVRFF